MECTRNCKGIYRYVTHSLDKEKRYYWITFLWNTRTKRSQLSISHPLVLTLFWTFSFSLQVPGLSGTRSDVSWPAHHNAYTRNRLTEASIPILCKFLVWARSLPKLMSLSRWGHPTISSSVVPFSFHLQSFPESESFQMSQFFTSGGQSIEILASAMNIQDWFPLGWTGWISLLSKGLSRVFSNITVQKHLFFCARLSL